MWIFFSIFTEIWWKTFVENIRNNLRRIIRMQCYRLNRVSVKWYWYWEIGNWIYLLVTQFTTKRQSQCETKTIQLINKSAKFREKKSPSMWFRCACYTFHHWRYRVLVVRNITSTRLKYSSFTFCLKFDRFRLKAFFINFVLYFALPVRVNKLVFM